MIHFEIQYGKEKQEFKIPESLNEISVQRFVKFMEDVEEVKPKSLSDYEQIKDEVGRKKFIEGLPLDEIIDIWGDYYLSFVQFWGNIPDELATHLSREQVNWIYNIISAMLTRHKPTPGKLMFSHAGEIYLYPPAPENDLIKNRKDYFKGTRIIDLVEAFQFEKHAKALSKSEWGSLPFIIAIICRRENEQLPIKSVDREKWIGERTLIMRTLPLSEAFDVAFFLSSQKIISEKYSLLYSLLQIKHQLKNKNIFGTPTVGLPH